MGVLILAIVGMMPLLAQALPADDALLLRSCEARVTSRFRQWRFAPVSSEVTAFAKSRHENATVTFGDFDGDSRKDVALLIQDGAAPKTEYPGRLDSLHIAVCLSSKGTNFAVIDKPYCGDGITLTSKGRRYYDFVANKEGVYPRDGVSAYCFEKAGATYEFEDGKFHPIVDSD